ncbi:R3H domain-containing nucleic acid-binding protein [Nodularia harveyana UHCC-0300]|uniref:R3H domain-containing nucleic acid-binding protein n=1 Tax=Nodularia harveyana UHCC-0300 TaxID=2974287 RepID=A0ABU5UEI7_9CYAN|nr:R3H domain-containing nucleic acid-binding protein [Nodularia harveyana]MEA5581912.1 R3H domain-containing nucleic acid-binding protein [Nodularia harveyana UHCC-0300]
MMVESPMERGQQWLTTLLQLTGIPAETKGNLEIDPPQLENSPEIDSYWLTIDQTNLTEEQIRILLGPEGSVIDSIQYLANSVLNLSLPEAEQAFYTIELNGYRVKRQAEIHSMAVAAADEVRASGQEVEIKSLSSAERRQIHSFFQECADLQTFSRGREPHRYLVVCPATATE